MEFAVKVSLFEADVDAVVLLLAAKLVVADSQRRHSGTGLLWLHNIKGFTCGRLQHGHRRHALLHLQCHFLIPQFEFVKLLLKFINLFSLLLHGLILLIPVLLQKLDFILE